MKGWLVGESVASIRGSLIGPVSRVRRRRGARRRDEGLAKPRRADRSQDLSFYTVPYSAFDSAFPQHTKCYPVVVPTL